MAIQNVSPESGKEAAVAPEQAQKPEQAKPIEQPVQTKEPVVPEGVKERTTEQFDKLKESNKRLYEANRLLQDELTRKAQVEQQFAPVQQAQTPKQPQVEQFIEVDPVSGEQFVNEEKLKKAITETNQRATRAETAVQSYIQQQQYLEEKKQTEEAYNSHPDLDPQGDRFNVDLSRRTRSFLIDSMMNPADYKGRPLTFKEAADLAKAEFGNQPKAADVKAEEKETKKNLEDKEQASQAAQGVSSSTQTGPEPDAELADLQVRSRKGDMWAVAQRLTRIPHTTTSESKET